MQTLTLRQQEIYDYLKDRIVNRGYGPTVREIGSQFGIKSPNGVMCHLKALEKKGLISRESHMSRAIQLSDPPHAITELPYFGLLEVGKTFPSYSLDDRLDFSDLFSAAESCCFRVRGNDLESENIASGDTIVVIRQPTFQDGDLTVIVCENGMIQIRRLYQEKSRIRMETGLKSDTPLYVKSVVVIGIVASVIRQY